MSLDIHVYLHSVPPTKDVRIDELLRLIKGLVKQGDEIMADLSGLTAQVKANTDAEDSAGVLLTNLSGLIASLKNDPVQLQKLSDDLKSHADALSAAIIANTPAADVPPAPEP